MIEQAAAWTVSRALGVTAYLALTLEMGFGLLLSTRAAASWIAPARSMDVHRFLSMVSLLLFGGHGVFLLGEHFDAIDLLVPFLASHDRFAVGIGVVATWLAVLIHASFAVRAHIGKRTWRIVHYTSFGVYVLATAHGVLAGTDSSLPGIRGIYFASGALVGLLVMLRSRLLAL
jgi:predicted ferric reductase